jgi:sulfur carrier protein ThiS
LHSTLVKYSADGKTRKIKLDLPLRSTLGDLIDSLAIDQSEQPILLAVNGKVVDTDHILEDQDSIHLMMPISGG